MANQNLFEKYGIKEVADVTFYRIERKNEVYESQREISVSSILKGAITTQMVYPMDEGKGADTGFEAYVFADADVLTHANYKCDDNYIDSEAENTEVTYTLTSEKFTVGTPTKEYVIQNGTPSITLDTKIKNKLTNIISSSNLQTSVNDETKVKTWTVDVVYEVDSVYNEVTEPTHEYSY